MKLILKQPNFGAIISDIDLNTVSEDEKKELRRYLHSYKVLSFEEQNLDKESLVKVANLFGTVKDEPLFDSKTNLVSTVERDHLHIFGGNWHNDIGPLTARAAYTILYSKDCPREGGDTLFLDNTLIYEKLPSILKDYLRDKKACFSFIRPYISLEESIYSKGTKPYGGNSFLNREYSETDVKRIKKMHGGKFSIYENKRINKTVESVQPLVVTHPRTNQPVLNLNSSWTHSIQEETDIESERILQLLFNHQESSLIYSLKWKPNMLTIWDNRLVLHKATECSLDTRRIMYRLMSSDPLDKNQE